MKNGKRGKVITIFAVALAVMLACRGRTSDDSIVTSSAITPMRQVVDDLGRSVTIPVEVTRIVSLAPSLTENIFAVGAGDRLVGVTTFCNYPEQAKQIARVGDTMNPNIETIVALKPDIVFVSTASQIEAFAKTLADNGIAVYVTNPVSLDDVFRSLIMIGDVLGQRQQADNLVVTLSGRESYVRHATRYDRMNPNLRIPHPRVFVQISKEPLFTIGKDSFLTQVVESAGGVLVTKDVATAYPKLSKETALALSPDVIILSESDDNREPNEVFRNSPAVKNGRVISINADLLSRPGPRLVDALEQIARSLHPEKLK